ncbi:MAG TPA: DUF6538 domain-containing protein, partial [Thermohalobaculum sp.]|nr:DUF6538 domain-containing protein [Thermohalobaculum sp.]
MTTSQHLIRRNGVYQFRMRVPLDVADAFGRTHVHHSLRTKNLTEAGRLRDAWFFKYQAEFERLRAQQRTDQQPSAYRIALARLKPLIEDWLQTQLQLVASDRVGVPDPTDDPDEIDESDDDPARVKAELRADLMSYGGPSPHLHYGVKRFAYDLLLRGGAPTKPSPSSSSIQPPDIPDIDEGSPEFRRLCVLVGAALQEATRAHLALLEGRPFEPKEEPLAEISGPGPSLAES